jgi:hypothetical protein
VRHTTEAATMRNRRRSIRIAFAVVLLSLLAAGYALSRDETQAQAPAALYPERSYVAIPCGIC